MIIVIIFVVLLASYVIYRATKHKFVPKKDMTLVDGYMYDEDELELMKLINDYRKTIGLNELEIINHLSYKSAEHNMYMISKSTVSHDGFTNRAENIMNVLNATSVAENVAVGFKLPTGVLMGWLKSLEHKSNIEGKYTHFGISIKSSPVNNVRYFTNIFMYR